MSKQVMTMEKNTVAEFLNQQVANWNVLYVKLHHFHWQITGPDFFTLHAKFEELYNEAADTLDLLAERILAIGGKPAGTMSQYVKLASISEASGDEAPNQMVQAVVSDFTKIIAEMKEGMEVAEKAGDEGTSDILLGLCTSLEKHVWMLNAYLK